MRVIGELALPRVMTRQAVRVQHARPRGEALRSRFHSTNPRCTRVWLKLRVGDENAPARAADFSPCPNTRSTACSTGSCPGGECEARGTRIMETRTGDAIRAVRTPQWAAEC